MESWLLSTHWEVLAGRHHYSTHRCRWSNFWKKGNYIPLFLGTFWKQLVEFDFCRPKTLNWTSRVELATGREAGRRQSGVDQKSKWTSGQWKKSWLFRVYRGVYYPIMWGWYGMITNHCKDPYFRGLRFVAGFRQIGRSVQIPRKKWFALASEVGLGDDCWWWSWSIWRYSPVLHSVPTKHLWTGDSWTWTCWIFWVNASNLEMMEDWVTAWILWIQGLFVCFFLVGWALTSTFFQHLVQFFLAQSIWFFFV